MVADNSPLALALVGLLGAAHCAGMCGGIISALALSAPAGKAAPRVHLAYHLGRLSSYMAAGAIAGALGGIVAELVFWQRFLQFLASSMLIAMGVYLCGATASLAWLEKLGQRLWHMLQPLTKRFLPVQGVRQALPLGMLWGWLPCGLVYGALTVAMTQGSAGRGALAMLAFGLGTLPHLLLMGMLAQRARRFLQARALRCAAGALIMAFGMAGLFWLAREIIRNP
ncbi:MAG: sulfite exporter TauE/SafE family protein [Rhodocyclaceae bacterium]|nr:sulfite exporter TauE/SafE family protein [Rhodocyclaceae bacterium]